jgi:hypothetical protein
VRFSGGWEFRGLFDALSSRLPPACHELPRGAAALLTDSVPVVSGEASFKWLQTSPDPSLGMTISLVRQDGTTIDKVSIEP